MKAKLVASLLFISIIGSSSICMAKAPSGGASFSGAGSVSSPVSSYKPSMATPIVPAPKPTSTLAYPSAVPLAATTGVVAGTAASYPKYEEKKYFYKSDGKKYYKKHSGGIDIDIEVDDDDDDNRQPVIQQSNQQQDGVDGALVFLLIITVIAVVIAIFATHHCLYSINKK